MARRNGDVGYRARLLTLALGSAALAACCQVSPVDRDASERIATAEFPRDADRLACSTKPVDLAVATTRGRRRSARRAHRQPRATSRARCASRARASTHVELQSPDAPRAWSASHPLKVLDAEGQVERPTIRLAPHGVATVTIESLAIDLVSRCERLELVLSVAVEDRRALPPRGDLGARPRSSAPLDPEPPPRQPASAPSLGPESGHYWGPGTSRGSMRPRRRQPSSSSQERGDTVSASSEGPNGRKPRAQPSNAAPEEHGSTFAAANTTRRPPPCRCRFKRDMVAGAFGAPRAR